MITEIYMNDFVKSNKGDFWKVLRVEDKEITVKSERDTIVTLSKKDFNLLFDTYL